MLLMSLSMVTGASPRSWPISALAAVGAGPSSWPNVVLLTEPWPTMGVSARRQVGRI